MCGAELDLNQHSIDDHFLHLHALHVTDHRKYTQIKVDTNKQFKLPTEKPRNFTW